MQRVSGVLLITLFQDGGALFQQAHAHALSNAFFFHERHAMPRSRYAQAVLITGKIKILRKGHGGGKPSRTIKIEEGFFLVWTYVSYNFTRIIIEGKTESTRKREIPSIAFSGQLKKVKVSRYRKALVMDRLLNKMMMIPSI